MIVFDGGSTDNTQALMKDYLSAWPNLRYERAEKPGGIDIDMAKSVEFARGEYCWLFSGDDVMRPGAIDSIFSWLHLALDVYICKHTICDKALNIDHEHPVLKEDVSIISDFGVTNERIKWFESAVTTEAFFSFMSGLIIRTQKWQSIPLPPLFIGSCWGHVARLFELCRGSLRVCYIPQVFLDQRGDNDSFAKNGVVNRYQIGIEGYRKISEYYFGRNSLEAFHIRRALRNKNEFSLRMFLKAKYRTWLFPSLENRKTLDAIVDYAYCDTSIECFFKKSIYYLIPAPLCNGIHRLYKHMKMMMRGVWDSEN